MSFNVSYVYRILDKYSGPLNQITNRTRAFKGILAKTDASMKGMGQRLKNVSRKMVNLRTGLGAVGAGGALMNMIGIANRFEGSLNRVQAVTKATDDQMGLLRGQARKLGETTQFSASQAAEAMSFLGMAGMDVNKIMAAMPGMLDLAAAGNLDLAAAADISTNILTAFGMKIEELGHVSDALATAAASSNTNIYQMAEVMNNVASTARQAGVSFEETAAMGMILANAGIKGGEAGTQLMNAMRVLTNMAPKTAKGLAKLGIDPRKMLDSEGKIKDLTKLVDQLAKRGATMGDFFQIFDIRGAKAMAVLKDQGSKKLSEFTSMLQNSEGAAKEMADIMMKGLPGAIKELRSVSEELILMLMTTLIPTLLKISKAALSFMRNLKENHPTLMKWVAWGALIIPILAIVAVAIGTVVGAIGGLISFVGLIPLAIGAAIAALAALGAWLYKTGKLDKIIAVIKQRWFELKFTFQLSVKVFKKVFKDLKEQFDKFFGWLSNSWELFNKSIDKVRTFFGFGETTITAEETGAKTAAVQSAARDMMMGNFQNEMTGKIVISTEGGAKVEQAQIGPIDTGANLVMVE